MFSVTALRNSLSWPLNGPWRRRSRRP